MRILRYLTLTALVIVSAQVADIAAKNISVPRMYMFGFAASFNDSIVHFTEIQTVENVWIDHKSELMAGRENYSYQLRDYLANELKMPHRTCVIFYNLDVKKLEKEYLKMKRIYLLGKKKVKKKDRGKTVSHNEIRMIATSEFKFQTVDMSESNDEQ